MEYSTTRQAACTRQLVKVNSWLNAKEFDCLFIVGTYLVPGTSVSLWHGRNLHGSGIYCKSNSIKYFTYTFAASEFEMWTLLPADFQSCLLFSESSFHQANETLISTLCRGDELLPYKTSVKVLPTDSVVSSQTA